jgi:hypothetical protein
MHNSKNSKIKNQIFLKFSKFGIFSRLLSKNKTATVYKKQRQDGHWAQRQE